MTQPTFKALTEFFRHVGAAEVDHTEKTYLAHVIGVYHDMKAWNADAALCRAAMFHSIYGTELFQRFALPLARRGEVRELIGARAERLAYYNSAMDRSSFDQAVQDGQPPYRFVDRFTGEEVELSADDFDDLCRIHLCDWLEQAGRSSMPAYRKDTYRRLADRLGGVAKKAYEQVFGIAAEG